MIRRILVWDLPTRLFHWSLVLSFAGAFLTAESERWRELHVLFGYTLLGLLAFRLIWGFVGTRYARFADFVPGPRAALRYARSLAGRRRPHFIGHNPLGALAILLLLGLGFAAGISGWLLVQDPDAEWLEELHELLANGMLAVVILHVLGVLSSSFLHRENLVLAMLTGRKRGAMRRAIPGARPLVGWLLLAALAGFWAWNGFGVSEPKDAAARYSVAARTGLADPERGEDD